MMIECRDIEKVYDDESGGFKALRGVSFSIARGEFAAVTGPSGCGKSTLLSILGLLDKPTAGSYFLDGRDVSSLNDYDRSLARNGLIGFVFQSFNLLPRFSALENVCLPMRYAGLRNRPARERAAQLLESVGLKGREHSTPLQLSGGQRQRVAIARALANNPKLILADEPTGNLDSGSSVEILKLLRALNSERDISLVIVTHDPGIAAQARKVVKIKDGLIDESR